MPVIIIVLIVAVAALLFVARWRSRSRLLVTQKPKTLNGEGLRPLFGLNEDDARALERERELAAKEGADEFARKARAEKLESFEEFRQTWRESPRRMNTIELFDHAARLKSGTAYVQTVNEVLHERRPAGFSDGELADLIESHFMLLPLDEKTPGTAFTIKQEIAELRRVSKTKSETTDD